jgi:hypothetical protein
MLAPGRRCALGLIVMVWTAFAAMPSSGQLRSGLRHAETPEAAEPSFEWRVEQDQKGRPNDAVRGAIIGGLAGAVAGTLYFDARKRHWRLCKRGGDPLFSRPCEFSPTRRKVVLVSSIAGAGIGALVGAFLLPSRRQAIALLGPTAEGGFGIQVSIHR